MSVFKKRAFGTKGEEQKPEGPVQLDPSGPQHVCHHNPKPQSPSTKTQKLKGQIF